MVSWFVTHKAGRHMWRDDVEEISVLDVGGKSPIGKTQLPIYKGGSVRSEIPTEVHREERPDKILLGLTK